ncbi:phage major capsid protein [Bradyrhizobium arachidis]|uniref:phage major capsid protein n=1 Tax=Bradyrhizobium arachidis TaxID=858423 RepID=UPI002162E32B|nr:phage major capsid protein [Bradyrhizobium arachidis]UVO33791.1 phage major capsid protein [Bradyrhizobium arachidis]
MKTANVLEFKDTGEADDPIAGVAKELADLKAALETKAANDNTKLTDRLNALEAKMNRHSASAANDNSQLETKAFERFLRRGGDHMDDLEKKTLSLAGNTAITPPEFGKEIIKLLRQFSPIRQYAKVVTIGSSQVKHPRRTGSTAATWVDDIDDRTESEPSYDQVTLTPYEAATYTDISNQLLEDNGYDLAGEVASDLAESFGIAEGSAFVTGNGTTKPNGIMNASGIQSFITGSANGFPTSTPADVLIQMFHKLPAAHAQNGTWLMNRNTLSAIRQFKDGMGRYLVLDALTDGAPVTLLGRPIVEAIDMADIEANSYPILFGNLQGYRIVDRVSFEMLRDPYSMATKGQTRFHARKRVGADVTHPDRFIKLKVSAT